MALAKNLWWTWHPEVISLFRDLDPIRWRQLDHSPIALLREFTPERLAVRAAAAGTRCRACWHHWHNR
jgi:starch phosphorylase